MATFVYDNAANKLASGVLVWTSMPVKVALVNANYVPQSSHMFMSQVPSTAIEVRGVTMTAKAVTADFIAQGKIPEFSALTSSFPITGIIFYNDTGTDGTSDLLYYSSDAVGFPLTPKALNWQIAFNQVNRGFLKVQ